MGLDGEAERDGVSDREAGEAAADDRESMMEEISATAVKLLDRLVKERSKELIEKLHWYEKSYKGFEERELALKRRYEDVVLEMTRLRRQIGDCEVALSEHKMSYFENVERKRIVDAYNRVVDERDELKDERDKWQEERRKMTQELVLLRMDVGVKT